ncbi:MAG TPA: ester cyclase [Acidimicrobiales bacterium]|nr:ester cyclase [Acidimicrobiales bacterium]
MREQDAKQLAERYHAEIYGAGDYGVADEILSPDFAVFGTGCPEGGGRGPAFVKEDAAAYRAAFTVDLSHDTVLAAGDHVVIAWTFRGEHIGPFGEQQATHRKVVVSGIDLFRIEAGRLAELRQYWDLASLTAQLEG